MLFVVHVRLRKFHEHEGGHGQPAGNDTIITAIGGEGNVDEDRMDPECPPGCS